MKRMLAALILAGMLMGMVPMNTAAEENDIQQIMARMSLRDKIAQMLMVEIEEWDENPQDDIAGLPFTRMNDQVREMLGQYRFGAVIYFAKNLTGTEQAYTLTRAVQQAAVDGGGLPMFICADQEGGVVYRLGEGTALPGNMALGAAGDPLYSYMAGTVMGSELSAIGINTNLAPAVDVNSNAANPVIGLRSYGDDPQTVGQLASETIAGMAVYDVAACAKHFPGHGDTATDSHYGLPMVDKSLEELRANELIPFETVIDRGVDMVMTAHILYPQLETGTEYSVKTGKQEALPATMSPNIITGLLKEEMGFRGVVVTDAMNMAGIVNYWDPVQAVVLAIRAGADMICMPCSLQKQEDLAELEAILQGVEAAVEAGTVSLSRIEDAVERILTVKQNRGILDWNGETDALETALQTVGGDANREIERYIAAAAVTVVENRNETLPLRLREDSRVLMLVPYENEKAQMLVGWNRAAEAGLIPEGAQVRVERFNRETTLDTFRQQIDWADTLIFNSEINRSGLLSGGRWESAYILNVLSYAKQMGKTTIVQSVDKPYDVQSYPDADAVLAVYGCKGSSLDPTTVLTGSVTGSQAAFGPNIVAGIEVMFGVFGAEGRLPVDIPLYKEGAFRQEFVYPRGYGLHYDSLITPPELPETEPPAEETTVPIQPETTEQTVPRTVPEPEEAAPPESPGKAKLWIPLAMAVVGVLLLITRKRRRKK